MSEFSFPREVYLPTYGLTGVAYQAAIPPDGSWRSNAYGPNTATLDSNAINALDDVVTGPIVSWAQLDAAELAVRAMILHEKIYWLLPAILKVTPQSIVRDNRPPVVEDTGHVIYPRYNEPEAIMTVLQQSKASSYAVYSSWIYVKNNLPVEGHDFWINNYDRLISKDLTVVENVFKESFSVDYFRNSYFSSPKAIGSGSYFGLQADREYEANLVDGCTTVFPERALRLLDENWENSVSGASIGLNIKLGPFLAIVLSRAKSRDQIPMVILELREEFQEAREDFWQLFLEPLTERCSIAALRKLRNIERAIQSIVPSSFPTNERPFSFLWDTAHTIADIALTGGYLAAMKFGGDSLLKRNSHYAQASTIELTKKLTSELKSMDDSLVQQLKRHLSEPELRNIGLSQ